MPSRSTMVPHIWLLRPLSPSAAVPATNAFFNSVYDGRLWQPLSPIPSCCALIVPTAPMKHSARYFRYIFPPEPFGTPNYIRLRSSLASALFLFRVPLPDILKRLRQGLLFHGAVRMSRILRKD